MIDIQVILEYLAFGGSLFSTYLYGRSGYKGPIAGLITCIIFISFGFVAEIYAAIISNIVFFVIHSRNLRKSMKEDINRMKSRIEKDINHLAETVMPDIKTAKWWNNPLDGQSSEYFHQIPLKISMIHSEVAEMTEAHRRSYIDDNGSVVWHPDDKIPHIPGLAKELGDTIVRCLEVARANHLDVGAAIAEIIEHNKNRLDHKTENQVKPGGKRY